MLKNEQSNPSDSPATALVISKIHMAKVNQTLVLMTSLQALFASYPSAEPPSFKYYIQLEMALKYLQGIRDDTTSNGRL